MAKEDRHLHGVVSTCLNIYSSMSGTGDPLGETETNELLEWLRWRVGEGWVDHSLEGWAKYEDSIRAMARALLKAMDADDWAVDCIAFTGRVLTGKHAHWCVDWDDLPIDETLGEYHLDQVIPDDTDVACASCGFKAPEDPAP